MLSLFRSWPDNSCLCFKQLFAKLTTLLFVLFLSKDSLVFPPLTVRWFNFLQKVWCFLFPDTPRFFTPSVSYPYFPSIYTLRSSISSGLSGPHLNSLISRFFPNSHFLHSPFLGWIRWILSQARVDDSFGAHSVRGMSGSLTFSKGSSFCFP